MPALDPPTSPLPSLLSPPSSPLSSLLSVRCLLSIPIPPGCGSLSFPCLQLPLLAAAHPEVPSPLDAPPQAKKFGGSLPGGFWRPSLPPTDAWAMSSYKEGASFKMVEQQVRRLLSIRSTLLPVATLCLCLLADPELGGSRLASAVDRL